MAGDDPFAEFDDNQPSTSNTSHSDNSFSGGDRNFAEEIFSQKVEAQYRTYYIDVKESRNGRFTKISEKSRGRKTTILIDKEDLPKIIEALQSAGAHME